MESDVKQKRRWSHSHAITAGKIGVEVRLCVVRQKEGGGRVSCPCSVFSSLLAGL